jgi:hypothetical protein
MPNGHLVKHGCDPEHRIHYTGHKTHVHAPWVPSIGSWAMLTSAEFTDPSYPKRLLPNTNNNSFRQYRYRYGLMTGPEFRALHGENPWEHAEQSWLAHRAAKRAVVKANGDIQYSIGMACFDAYQVTRYGPYTKALGMMPVELVLWTRLFDLFLGTITSYAEWRVIDDADKLEIWKAGYQGQPWSIELVTYLPAIFTLPARQPAGLAATG